MTIPEELYKAYKLLNDGKEEEAWKLINKREKLEHLKSEQKHIHMMFKGSVLFLTGSIQESINIAEEMYQESKVQGNELNAIDALILKSYNLLILARIKEMGENIIICEEMLKSVIQEPLPEIEWRDAMIRLLKGYFLNWVNEFDKALKELNNTFRLVEKYETLSILLPLILSASGSAYTEKGELDLALGSHKKSLNHSKGNYMVIRIVNATSYHNIGEIYFQKGDFDQAIEHYEKSLKIWDQFISPVAIGWVSINYNSLINAFLYKGSSERAYEHLNHFLDYLKKRKLNEDFVWYTLGKARILTSSSRTRDRAEAERIIKKYIAERDALVESGIINVPDPCPWYLLICDLYLKELRLTNDLSVLNDIKPFITRLLNELERTNSYTLQVQTCLLQGKISLLDMNIGDARRYITQAQRVAEEHNLHLLAREISAEHDKCLEQLDEWENLKRKKASITERMDLASLDITMDRIQGRRAIEPPELIDEKPILLLIIGQDGVPYFNHSFSEDWDYNDLFSLFMSAFNTFSSEIFSESIDRIKIGGNLIIIKLIEPFLVCYVIKGQSYPALLKLTRFSDAIKWKSEIWDALNKAVNTSEILELNNPSSLGDVVNEIFNLE
ncbi:MAG: tetratricopeptide repeat protein [Promethearchaeota archaeon]|jgi:tetratricopeptide (TPR) repeat protein